MIAACPHAIGIDSCPRLVFRIRLVAPAAVVEIRVVVCNLAAVQPVDRHPGPGGVRVVAGVDRGRRPHHPELRAVAPDGRVPRRHEVLHEGVVDADVGRRGVALRRGHEYQPELVAVRQARGREGPGRADRVFLRRRPAGQGQEGGDRYHQAGRGPEEAPGEGARTPPQARRRLLRPGPEEGRPERAGRTPAARLAGPRSARTRRAPPRGHPDRDMRTPPARRRKGRCRFGGGSPVRAGMV